MLELLDIPCIEANAADVVEVLRSTEPVALAKGNATFATQAYIGIVKRENRHVIYAALHVREIQRSLVYGVEGRSPSAEAARKEGEEFLADLGFRLEPVALKFSPAMREVILREIPVILPPETAQRIAREKEKQIAEWQRLVDEPDPEPATEGPELSLAVWTQRKREQDALTAAKKAAAEHLAAEGRVAAKVATLREIVDGFRQQIHAGEMAASERSERERLQAMLALARGTATEMQTRIARLEEELAAGKAERVQFAQTKKVADVLLAECRQQLAQAEQAREREAQERRNSELARKDAEKRLRSLYEIAQKMKEQFAAANADRTRLAAEKEAAEQTIVHLRKEALQAGERFQAEVARHQQSRNELLEKLSRAEDELRQQRILIAQGEAERLRLGQALAAANRSEEPAIPAARPAAEEDGRWQDTSRQPAEGDFVLRNEIERLLAANAELATRLAKVDTEPLRNAPAPAANRTAKEDLPAKNATEPPPHVVRRPPPADAFFRVDWDLSGVPYDAPDDVCEVRKTMNRVRLSLEGYPDQYCSAGLVVTQTTVYVAFRLSVSDRVLVYVPVTPPETPTARGKALKEAEKFLQVVGLDPEPVPLSKNPRQRAKTLENIAFLSHPPMSAGNF